MKINFLDFWDGFDPNNNFFLYLFRDIFGSADLTPIEDCDVVIYSCFGNSHLSVNKNKAIKIFYTGENVRPDFDDCNFSFTFDFNDYDERNIRVPLYYLYIDWFNTKTWGNPEYLISPSALEDNEFIQTKKTKFCATIFSNPAYPRMELYNLLSGYKQVDGYGRPFNNHSSGELKKYQILSEYKFSICPENSRWDGYYTEKLLHAKTAGTIPIYLADTKVAQDFNKKSFINVNDFTSEKDLLDFIVEIDNNEQMYLDMFHEPLFVPRPSLERIKRSIYLKLK